jgi:poly(A) polymerase
MHRTSSVPPPDFRPNVVPRREHNISRSLIDPDALKILYRLNRYGHTAYLVGGSVRDLLLGRTPKDFDISTSAHPNEIKKLFGNCRLIGRRFRLAHVFFRGGKIIEVSTFRTISEFDMEDGPVVSDNTFGTPWEDAFRRDFTVNALFYNLADFSVIDYVGGLEDLRKGVIRCIGDPDVRFREDPIRMLRGVRFASLLGFNLDKESSQVIGAMRDEIWKGALPRILEEILRMMDRGSGKKALLLLDESGFLATLFPEIHSHGAVESLKPYLDILEGLDARFASGRDVEPWLVLSCLLYPLFDLSLRTTENVDLVKLARESIMDVCARIQIPRKIQDRMRQITAAQPRLFGLGSTRFQPRTILRKSYFTDAFTLFEIVASTSDEGCKLISGWRALIENSKQQRPTEKKGHRRRRRGKRYSKPSSAE